MKVSEAKGQHRTAFPNAGSKSLRGSLHSHWQSCTAPTWARTSPAAEVLHSSPFTVIFFHGKPEQSSCKPPIPGKLEGRGQRFGGAAAVSVHPGFPGLCPPGCRAKLRASAGKRLRAMGQLVGTKRSPKVKLLINLGVKVPIQKRDMAKQQLAAGTISAGKHSSGALSKNDNTDLSLYSH